MKKILYDYTSLEFPSSSFIIKLVNFTSEIPPPESIGTGSVRKCSSISKMLIKKRFHLMFLILIVKKIFPNN